MDYRNLLRLLALTHWTGHEKRDQSGEVSRTWKIKWWMKMAEEVPVGQVGELIVRGPNVMKGYYKMPEETQATIKDGWLYTGDMARMDEEEYFYIVDRKKELILDRWV